MFAIYKKSERHFFDQVVRDGEHTIAFYHLWPLGQKSVIQIFDKLSDCKIIKQNVPGGLILAILTPLVQEPDT